MKKISVSIVVYKPDLTVLNKTLISLSSAVNNSLRNDEVAEITIVDNSPDSFYRDNIEKILTEDFKDTKNIFTNFIKTNKNVGYGSGNNIAIKLSTSQYHLVLNPDVFIHPNALKEGLMYLDSHRDVGLLTPAVFGENGERHYLCKQNPTLFDFFLRSFAPEFVKHIFNKRMDLFEMRDHDYEQIIEPVPLCTGCFMLMRKEILDKVGSFDERYFMYLEDADLTRHILKEAKTVYLPNMSIVHLWKREAHYNLRLCLNFIRSAFNYFWKWGGLF